MHVRALAVSGCHEFTPRVFPDHRGLFVAPFQESVLTETLGHPLHLAQTNHSNSRRGTIRGLHFADTPPGQAKYVYCSSGSMIDIVVDVRVGSPSFGHWDSVRLDTVDYRAIYVAEGIAHGFVALEDNTAMTYLCSTGYNPGGEHGITPFDESLNLPWPTGFEHVLSEKDINAPTLAEAEKAGILPKYEDCLAHYEALRAAAG